MSDDKPPIPLDYATPAKKRSFEAALTDFVEQEVSQGRLQPAPQMKMVGVILIFAWLLIVLTVLGLVFLG